MGARMMGLCGTVVILTSWQPADRALPKQQNRMCVIEIKDRWVFVFSPDRQWMAVAAELQEGTLNIE